MPLWAVIGEGLVARSESFVVFLSVVEGEARNGNGAEVGLVDEEVLSENSPGPSPNGKEG